MLGKQTMWVSAGSVIAWIACSAPAGASGSLYDTAILLQSFPDASGTTTITADFDGTWIWTAAGGNTGKPLARHFPDGTFDQTFLPGIDFRSLYTDNSGNLFAKEYGGGNVYSISPAGAPALLYTLNDANSQSGGALNADDSELWVMSDGQIRRYDSANGGALGQFALAGWGSVGTENVFPDDFQMQTSGAGRVLTYTQGIVSEWDQAGNRIGTCTVADINDPGGFNTTWSFAVDGFGRVYLYEESTLTWKIFDVGVGGAAPGAYCFGTGCPCGNDDGTGMTGCLNSTGAGASLATFGAPSISSGTFGLSAAGAIPAQPGLFFQGDIATNGGMGLPFGDGLRCAGTNVVRLETVLPDGAGGASTSVDVAVKGGVSMGDLRRYQFWYRDPGPPLVCGSGFNLTNGIEITWSS